MATPGDVAILQLSSMDKKRGKGRSIFRPQLAALKTIHDVQEIALPATYALRKKTRHPAVSSQASPSSPSSGVSSEIFLEQRDAAQAKHRNKSRPKSVFGSFNSYHALEDERGSLTKTISDTNSVDDSSFLSLSGKAMALLHHGEVQVGGSMFRKKTQYLVLTDTHLLRFKNQVKAAEVFSEIPSSPNHTPLSAHYRMSSGGSGTESQLHTDVHNTVPLQNMVAVYKLDDGRSSFSIELASYEEPSNTATITTIQLNDPQEADLWLSCLKAAITKSRLTGVSPFGQKAIAYAARQLESESDYMPSHFQMFTVTQRASRSGTSPLTEDVQKLVSSVLYLVIGLHKLHLLPLPRASRTGSSSSLSELSGTSYGIACLSAINLQPEDDAFHLSFRSPLHPCSTLHLASTSVQDIALCLRQAADHIRPLWVEQPFTWHVPTNIDENILPLPSFEDEDHLSFDRTLTAYCVGYGIDPSNIRYTVDYDCVDAPEFILLGPNNSKRTGYNSSELLAVLRALRYNESFRSISFRQVKLDALHNLCDRHGSEHFSWSSKSGRAIRLPRLDTTPLLVQELQCLALKSTQLKKVDFSDSLTRQASAFTERDRGSGICEAIFPLCTLRLTNIDWISLSGIALSFLDLEYLRAAGTRKACHFRGLELSRCSLTEDSLDFTLSSIKEQCGTLDCLDLSNNPAKINHVVLMNYLEHFTQIRHLNLSKLSFMSNSGPILTASMYSQWKLDVLDLSSTSLNPESVNNLAAYLASQQSSTLGTLRLENCMLTGEDVAKLLQSTVHGWSEPRKLHLYVSGNRLEKKHNKLVKAIAASSTPTHLTMQALEYNDEKNFRHLLHALATSTALEYLDISRVSIPYDASEEACEELKFMFENNRWLKELNISGEVAHLEAVTLGRGICDALRGLMKNKTLEVLRIENQALGFPGAEALATVLESSNCTLRQIYCDNNKMGLQAFSMLVNAIEGNENLLWLAAMNKDRHWNREKIEKEAEDYINSSATATTTSTRSSVRKALSNAVPGRSASHRSVEKYSPSRVTEQDLEAAMARIDDSWDIQTDRLSGYLKRNYDRAHDLNLLEFPSGSESRPSTGLASLKTALAGMSIDHTPRAEHDRQLTISTTKGMMLEDEVKLDLNEESFGNELTMGMSIINH
ncbi:MAG: hypothetical protein GOMPHAMPRED_007782 [Gomphillus americanus]|uniref:PH domain-containing protein n=1 Tax=Gomphillus americanus TaxID=1940652 RepID=A0A8H3F1U3_9LECA|nr:MAG: hypothetical protein GOMPHAMPRED_007782 [Gomphillus americanus]